MQLTSCNYTLSDVRDSGYVSNFMAAQHVTLTQYLFRQKGPPGIEDISEDSQTQLVFARVAGNERGTVFTGR